MQSTLLHMSIKTGMKDCGLVELAGLEGGCGLYDYFIRNRFV